MALLVTTTIVFGTSLWVFQKVHDTVATVRTSTVPAIIDVLAAQDALVGADTAAIDSFQNGGAQLIGPGQQYQSQLASASRSLAQVAEDNAAGDPASQTIQLVEGLLVSYAGLIGQADANFRQGTAAGISLGVTDLWYASRFLGTSPESQYSQGSGILAQLDELLKAQQRALDAQLSASAMTMGVILVWALPMLALFGLLGVTQILLKRRFHRALNPLLLLATVFLVGLSAVTSLAIVSQHRLENAQNTLNRLVEDWSVQISAADTQRLQTLTELVTEECRLADGGCGVTVTEFVTDIKPAASIIEVNVPERTKEVRAQFAAASTNSRFGFLIPLLVVLIVASILLGLRPRIEEYRYRPR